jgi:hypothetical protein
LSPVFYLYCMMDRVTIDDEKYGAFNLTYHAFEEPEENLSAYFGPSQPASRSRSDTISE